MNLNKIFLIGNFISFISCIILIVIIVSNGMLNKPKSLLIETKEEIKLIDIEVKGRDTIYKYQYIPLED